MTGRLGHAGPSVPSRRVRALVTGAAGRLGGAVCAELAAAGHDVTALTRNDLDVTDRPAVARTVTRLAPDVVINCTAFNAVDAAEHDEVTAFQVNAAAPRFLAEAAAAAGAVFVHYSTDFVFDGATARPYVETDAPAPLGVYGASKLEGEIDVQRVCRRHYILRVASLFGGTETAGRRSTIDAMAERLLDGRQPVRAMVDRTVSPSHVADVARATRLLVERHAPHGVYHCVCSGTATWYDLAGFVAASLGVPPRIEGVRAADVHTLARRPAFCALSNGKLLAAGIQMPDWQTAVRRHVERMSAAAPARA